MFVLMSIEIVYVEWIVIYSVYINLFIIKNCKLFKVCIMIFIYLFFKFLILGNIYLKIVLIWF